MLIKLKMTIFFIKVGKIQNEIRSSENMNEKLSGFLPCSV